MAIKKKKNTPRIKKNDVRGQAEAKTDKSVVVAKGSDGSIQITFNFGWNEIHDDFEKAVTELGVDVEIAGFRKGKAPREKILAKLSPEKLVEKTLQNVLPMAYAKALHSNKILPAMYPKFEVISANNKEDWQVRAITCEMPEVNLGKYKEEVKGEIGKASIVTPENKDKQLTQEEKEQLSINAVLKAAQVNVPNILAQQEADTKLSQLLERLEKLGLTLDKYLESIKKSAEDLRADYMNNAREAIKLELVLLKIADELQVKVQDNDVDQFIKAAQGDPNVGDSLDTADQKQIIKSIIKKRMTIEKLASLA